MRTGIDSPRLSFLELLGPFPHYYSKATLAEGSVMPVTVIMMTVRSAEYGAEHVKAF